MIDRLMAKRHVDPATGCWIWQGGLTTDGYGHIAVTINGRRRWPATHRLAYELLREPIPDGLVIDHLCRNRACFNPDHLEPVTQQTNLRRGATLQAANLAKTHCKFGHEFTPENTRVVVRGRRCKACERRRGAESYARRRAAAG